MREVTVAQADLAGEPGPAFDVIESPDRPRSGIEAEDRLIQYLKRSLGPA